MTELKYPGDWVASQLLEGTMQTHREQVAEIAEAIGSSLEPDTAQYVNRFTVPSTSSSKMYLVSQRRTSGQWCCSCRGWTTHRHCRHLNDICARLGSFMATAAALGTDKSAAASSVVAMLVSAQTPYQLLGGIK